MMYGGHSEEAAYRVWRPPMAYRTPGTIRMAMIREVTRTARGRRRTAENDPNTRPVQNRAVSRTKHPPRRIVKPDTNCDRIDGYALVRISGTSYILSCTRMCRQLGVVDGEYVKVTLERTGKAADGEDREISPCIR